MQKKFGYYTITTMAKMKKKDITSTSVQEIFADFGKKIRSLIQKNQILIEKIYTKLEEMDKKERDFWSQYPWVSH